MQTIEDVNQWVRVLEHNPRTERNTLFLKRLRKLLKMHEFSYSPSFYKDANNLKKDWLKNS